MIKTKIVEWDLFNRKPLLDNPKKDGKVIAFVQARTGSTRLPNKIYHDINGAPMLWHTINKARLCKLIDDVVIISPGVLPELPENVKGFAYDGNENDVIGRYAAALKKFPCDYALRLTSDCPLLDHYLIDYIIAHGIGSHYCSNVLPCTFPDGMDAELISAETLKALNQHALEPFDREHVTTYIRNRSSIQVGLSIVSIQAVYDQSFIKLSVDTEADLNRVREIEKKLCRTF